MPDSVQLLVASSQFLLVDALISADGVLLPVDGTFRLHNGGAIPHIGERDFLRRFLVTRADRLIVTAGSPRCSCGHS